MVYLRTSEHPQRPAKQHRQEQDDGGRSDGIKSAGETHAKGPSPAGSALPPERSVQEQQRTEYHQHGFVQVGLVNNEGPVKRHEPRHQQARPPVVKFYAQKIAEQCAAQPQQHLRQPHTELGITQNEIEDGQKHRVQRRAELRVARVVPPDDVAFEARFDGRQMQHRPRVLRMVHRGIVYESHVHLEIHGDLKIRMFLQFIQVGQANRQPGQQDQHQRDPCAPWSQ
ncbi:MAG: hypothetical protein BWX80_01608 [Candidatus Hydrogenedentes bacterium ADurb.Bin101]|nr:MAG: hypothetical protein BWX80_01608 [Candidatus Hydrogenedentes bacterium ADurb.Bin101]